MSKIDCKKIAADVKEDVRHFLTKNDIRPMLAVVTFNIDPASEVYVTNKNLACNEVGIDFKDILVPLAFQTENVIHTINLLNKDESVNGILVQLPLPDHIDVKKVLEAIDPKKDVDGLTPWNTYCLYTQKPQNEYLQPCTPMGVVKVLKETLDTLEEKDVLMIGRSTLVGRPLAELLTQENATVTLAHSYTPLYYSRYTDIVISAVGKEKAVPAALFRSEKDEVAKLTFVDVGINRNSDGKLCGDIDYEGVNQETDVDYTSVPGGIGVMTTAMLTYNVAKAYCLQHELDFCI